MNFDWRVVIYLLLEDVVSLNQQAITFLQDGQEFVAVSILKDALGLLALISRNEGDRGVAHTASGEGHNVESLCSGLRLFSLPPIFNNVNTAEAPGPVVCVLDDGTFSIHHGLENAQEILVGLIVYHMALAIHRGCCRANGIDRLELTRSRDLYDACDSTFANVPMLKPMKFIVDASIGQLLTMFDCPAAA
jgi:hypothetical protein